MPLGEQEGLLIGAGITLSLATTYFYRQRQTLPFKVDSNVAAGASHPHVRMSPSGCLVQIVDRRHPPRLKHAAQSTTHPLSACIAQWAHFLAWPVLGTGILLAMSPTHDQMANTLRESGLAGAGRTSDGSRLVGFISALVCCTVRANMSTNHRHLNIADDKQQSAAQAAAQQQILAIRQKAAESKPFKPSV